MSRADVECSRVNLSHVRLEEAFDHNLPVLHRRHLTESSPRNYLSYHWHSLFIQPALRAGGVNTLDRD